MTRRLWDTEGVRSRGAALHHDRIMTGARANLARIGKMRPAPVPGSVREAGKIAFVAGSGPSLPGALPLLAEHRDRFTVFCADTALPVLCRVGVRPEWVFNIDSDAAISSRSFTLPSPRSTLLCPTFTGAEALTAWTGNVSDRVRYFNLWSPHNPDYAAVDRMFPKFPRWDSLANVGHFAFNAAFRAGYERIAFAGLDFCYAAGAAAFYAEGVAHDAETGLGRHDEMMLVDGNLMARRVPVVMAIYLDEFMSYYNVHYRTREMFNLSDGIIPLRNGRAALEAALK